MRHTTINALMILVRAVAFVSLGLVANVFAVPRALADGGLVGNGGDTVECDNVNNGPFTGYVSLDYALTFRHATNNADIVYVRSWEESRTRLTAILRKHPDLAYGFADFTKHLFNAEYGQPRLWKEAAHGLINLNDEKIIRQLPGNCRQQTNGQVNLIQTVIRTKRPDLVVYEYDPKIVEELKKWRSIQLSFLLVHEWLWDYTQDVAILRDVNRYLHSKTAEERDEGGFRADLTRLGLDLSGKSFVPICDRPTVIRDAIERALGMSCESISREYLESKKPNSSGTGCLKLQISGEDLRSISPNDFGYLYPICDVTIENSQLEYIAELTFAGVAAGGHLRHFFFAGNRLTIVTEGFLKGLRYPPFNLDLSNNQIQDIPDSFCDYLPRRNESIYQGADLRGNPLNAHAIQVLQRCNLAAKAVKF